VSELRRVPPKAKAHRSTSQRPLKIVVTGPFAAGKTTLIETISEVAIVATERDVSEHAAEFGKPRTTVAMDFGRLTFGEDCALFLFGTPGQRRFEVMWEILSEGMIGFILLVHATDPRSLEEAGHIFEQFKHYADVPYLVGVTHTDLSDTPAEELIEATRSHLGLTDEIKVVVCDPRSKEEVKALMLSILYEVHQRIEAKAVAG
jgi:signal recognition particle receptor subunit beta